MSKRRSLADDLANLFNPAPAPDIDPETAGVDLPVLPDVDEDFESHIKPTRTAKEKPLRLRGDIELHDQAYKGRKSTRAAVFDDSDGDASGSDEDGDEDEEDDEDELDDGLEALGRAGVNGVGSDEDESDSGEDDEDEGSGEERRASGATASTRAAAPVRASSKPKADARKQQSLDRRRKQQRGGDGGEGGSASEEEERGESSGGEDPGAEDLEQQQLDAEYKALEEAEAAALVGLRERAEKERVKGRAVAVQQRLYERSLESRILLQKVVGGGNVLPRPDELPGVLRMNEGLKSGYAELRTSALETLTTLLQLHSALVANNPAIVAAAAPPTLPPASNGTPHAASNGATPTATPAAGSKRSSAAAGLDRGLEDVEGAWAAMEEQWGAVAPFRDASLDRWHRRTMLAAGGAALKAGGLKALHQSVSAQVSSLIRDNTKAVKRTRLSLSSRPRVLCSSDAPPAAPADAAPGEPRRAAASEAHEDGDEAQDPETFDDGEFYQQLLKELIDFSAAGGSAGGHTGQKKRKSVDRRASKGRKIRYHVHPKLVNFVAPVETALPVFAAQLFSNLFGRAAPAAVAGNA